MQETHITVLLITNRKQLCFADSVLFDCFLCRKEISLLDLVCRGTHLSTREANAITPLLSLFSSLLSNTLFSVHDNEFYGVEGKIMAIFFEIIILQ